MFGAGYVATAAGLWLLILVVYAIVTGVLSFRFGGRALRAWWAATLLLTFGALGWRLAHAPSAARSGSLPLLSVILVVAALSVGPLMVQRLAARRPDATATQRAIRAGIGAVAGVLGALLVALALDMARAL